MPSKRKKMSEASDTPSGSLEIISKIEPLKKGYPWTDLPAVDKLCLCQSAFELAAKEAPRLSFMINCVCIWPFRDLVQVKWSSMSMNARKNA
jgi:hypothetical protein